MIDWYENRRVQDASSRKTAATFVIPAKAGIQGRGAGGNVVRGLVPRWGQGLDWQNPPRRFSVPTRDSGFSSLGVPAEAGMSDWYENSLTQRANSTNSSRHIRHSRGRYVPYPPMAGGNLEGWRRMGKCSAGACPPLGSGREMADSSARILRAKPQPRLFIPWCAGPSRHERLI